MTTDDRGMTDLDPLSQDQVEREILRLSGELTRQTIMVRTSAQQAAQGDVDHKRATAMAWLERVGREGTVPEKEAAVTVACIAEYREWKLADAVFRADREKGQNLRSQLDALRTIAANQRAAIDYSRGTGG